MNPQLTQFLKDIDRHELQVLRDEGVYRHIRFKRPDTYCMYFDLVTWPGFLAYSGDMGCYVFNRLEDMFEFFRRPDESYRIDHGYWAEKVQAADKSAGIEEFCKERFTEVVNTYRLRWMRDGLMTKAQRRELWDAVQLDVIEGYSDDAQSCHQRAADFDYRPISASRSYRFDDFWEHRFTRYSHRFGWCCLALAWGIKKYDEHKASPSPRLYPDD